MNFGSPRISGWLVYGTAVAALLLTLVPLPDLLAVIRPPLLVMTVLYWSTLAPRTGGIFIGFAFGLALDIIQGEQLGQHALAYSLLAYHTACARGTDVDKPRNLAKSVTVE